MPEDYRWSSYRDYVNGGKKGIITDADNTLYIFSKRRFVAATKYKEFVNSGINKKSPLGDAAGSILGSEAFRERVMRYLKGTPDIVEIPETKMIEPKYNIPDIINNVATGFIS